MKRMTKERLKAYRSAKAEIAELEKAQLHIGNGDEMIDNTTVNDYRSGYPIPQAVVGVDWEKYVRIKRRYADRIYKLKKECSEIEEYVEGIEDSITRRIFRMYYIEGDTQSHISKTIHMDQSMISRKIDIYLKLGETPIER